MKYILLFTFFNLTYSLLDKHISQINKILPNVESAQKLSDNSAQNKDLLNINNYLDTDTDAQVILPFNTLVKEIKKHDFEKVIFSSDMKKVYSYRNDYIYQTNINPIASFKLIDVSIQNNIPIEFTSLKQTELSPFLYLPIGFILFNILSNRLRSMFPQNKNIKLNPKTNVTLNDWAGSTEILQEVTEILSFIKNGTKYTDMGATCPKGILLDGPPGSGKTLLAKAIANEANANFISIAASEFIELYVGIGAARVRKLFEEARKNKPCIIFIDEIDAIGKQRSKDSFIGNDERDQTLNQILTEMDGFTENDNILVIAATNRKDILDNALLRPGRFDRLITIPLPDLNARMKILSLYLKNKNIDVDINIQSIAQITNGYSGADLKNVINEAAIIAVRNNLLLINYYCITEAIEKISIGIKKNIDTRDLSTKTRIAIHEIGHATMVSLYPEYFDLQKVSIQSTYSNAGGYTLFNEKQDTNLYTKDFLMKRLILTLGGKAAEEIFFGEEFMSLGASLDLKQANELAKNMIEKFGMGNKLKLFSKNDKNIYSEKINMFIDNEVNDLVNTAYEEAKKNIISNKSNIELLVTMLLQKTTINNDEFGVIFKNLVVQYIHD